MPLRLVLDHGNFSVILDRGSVQTCYTDRTETSRSSVCSSNALIEFARNVLGEFEADSLADESLQKHVVDIRNLSRLVYGNSFTLWHYRSESSNLDTMMAAGYFGEASGMLTVGDMIILVGVDGARLSLVTYASALIVLLSPVS
jgi:hypothetical protein